MRHDSHKEHQQHERATPVSPAKTPLLRTPTQAQEVPIHPQHHSDMDDADLTNDQTAPSGTFDSNLQVLMLDDGTSACITNDKSDFIKQPKRVDRKVKGIKGNANGTHQGTLKWHIEDDHGLVHAMVIKGAYLIPDAVTRILSPQHLAQQADDHYPMGESTGALTTSKNITLFWAQRHFAKTVPLDSKMNMGLTMTAPGARSFCAFCTTVTVPDTKQTNIYTNTSSLMRRTKNPSNQKTLLSQQRQQHRRKSTKYRPRMRS